MHREKDHPTPKMFDKSLRFFAYSESANINHSFSIFRAHNDGTYGSNPHPNNTQN